MAMGEVARVASARLALGEEALSIARSHSPREATSFIATRPDLDLPSEAEVRRFAPIVERAARAHGVDEALVHAVIFAESSYDPRAVSPAGATGLMQLMPATAQHYGVRDLFDPAQNVSGGVRLLRDLLVQFDGNVELALAAYNAGANAVIRAGNRVPPYPATAAYVPKVIDYYRHFQSIVG
ncbi:MAG: lytic transglycosylase domain-containing protein [Betaproteobacteria bacterium]|nr:lytic transglycosylase domain-containing protein [Betaproteobacteria bacterium]